MKKISLFLLLNGIIVCSYAQKNIYSALTIPDSLRRNADVVVREEIIKLTIKDKNTARYEVRKVITIMNEQGKQYLDFYWFSYQFRVLEDAEIKLYDLLGNKKNSYSKKEMNSQNYGEGLVPEGKLTYFSVNAPSFPFTVEVIYAEKYRGVFNLPEYKMQLPWQSVQHSSFEVEVPSDLGVRYKLLNTDNKPLITINGSKESYKWEISDLQAYKLEKHSGSSDNYVPQVLFAPNKFQLDDYEGDMSTWKGFGDWYNSVYLKTTQLKEDRKQFYKTLVKDESTDIGKARLLYNYLQHNMRYVSIQLGIGGLQPFPASFVDDKKYGDCKALSNYLKSALDAVGVKSNVVIIEGSTNPGNVYQDFPAHYFNHVILCIPQPKDSIWLECTSTTLPFAELGTWTENRKAMMVTADGGVLINTPVSTYQSNTGSIYTVIDVNEEGGAKVNLRYNLQGDDRNDMLMYFHDLKDDEKRKFFISNMEWKHPDVLDISNSKNKDHPYIVTANMEYEKIYSFNAGSKLFFESRLYPIFDQQPQWIPVYSPSTFRRVPAIQYQ